MLPETYNTSADAIQPVPEKMRLEMLVGIQIEILDGEDILVNQSNRETHFSRYLAVQIRNEILVESEFLCISRNKFKSRYWFNLNLQLTKISPPFRISITI